MKKQPNMRHMESRAVLGYGGLIVMISTVLLPVALSNKTVSSTIGCHGSSILELRWS